MFNYDDDEWMWRKLKSNLSYTGASEILQPTKLWECYARLLLNY